MINRNLELKIKQLKEFMQLWIKFHDMYKESVSRSAISPEEEKTFLETKSLIARKYQALKNRLDMESSSDDRTFDVISRVLSLKGVAAISDLGISKIENDWHNSYIHLNKLLGELEGEKENLRRVSPLGLFIRRASQNPYIRVVLLIVIIFSVFFAVNLREQASLKRAEKESKIEFAPGP